MVFRVHERKGKGAFTELLLHAETGRCHPRGQLVSVGQSTECVSPAARQFHPFGLHLLVVGIIMDPRDIRILLPGHTAKGNVGCSLALVEGEGCGLRGWAQCVPRSPSVWNGA